MKRIISILLIIMMNLSVLCASASDADEALLRVQGYGIMQGDENSMRLDDNITRAEFAAVVCRMSGIFDVGSTATKFSDVPSDHWASGYINMAEGMGIVSGIGENLFAPDRFVTYNEAVKMVVCLLGYNISIDEKGGWPLGYMVQAGTIGILKNIDMSAEFATRGEIVKLIDAALDVEVISPDFADTDSYEKTGYTLADSLDNRLDTVYFEGIVTEAGMKTLNASTDDYEPGRVIIDGVIYNSDTDVSHLLGHSVWGYATKANNGKLQIVSVASNSSLNKIQAFSAEDVELRADGAVYYNSNGIEKTIVFEHSPAYVLNGRGIASPEAYSASDDALYTFIDNNANNKADVILIVDSQSFVISRISSKNSFVYFADNKFFRGRRGYELTSTDDDKITYLLGSDGNSMSFSEVEVGDAVTISASEDEMLTYVWISKKSISGTVSEIDSVGKVFIDGQWYRTDEKLSLGESGTFVVDKNNKIVGVVESESSDYKYGYIADAKKSSNLDKSLSILMIEKGSIQKEVKEVSGAEQISYYLQNSPENIYYCNEKLKFSDGYSLNGGSMVSADSISFDALVGKVARFKLNAEGKISSLRVYSVSDTIEKCNFNAEIFAFGGDSVSRGYIADKETAVICIPNTVKTTDDYGVRIYVTDGATYSATGINSDSDYEYDSDEYKREAVDVLIIKADMDSSRPYPIQSDSDICLVGEVTKSIDANGDEVGKIEMLNGEKVITANVMSDSVAYSMTSSLRMGDLVQYVTDADGNIANIKKLASVQGLRKYTSSGNYYGLAYDIHYDAYDYMSNEMTDLIELSFESGIDNKNIKIFHDGEQNIYHYDRTRGYVESATTDDLLTAVQAGDKASKIFALMEKNDALCLVIISD